MLQVQNLTRKYGSFTAVDDVSFSIPKGQVVGLLGHNGAGKTTIMKVLTGYLEPSAGSAQIDGLDVTTDRTELQKRIGYLPESSPVYPEMTVVEYLFYVANLRGISDSEQAKAVKAAVEKTQLHEKATSLVSTLSRGYKQRVGVAQAIIHNPDFLVLDEPTNGLDPSQIQEMRNLITGLSEDATVIISTHILQEVHAMCDRVLIIVHGKLGLDSQLSDLKSEGRYVLSVDKPRGEIEGLLKNVSGFHGLEVTGERSGHFDYVAEVEQKNGPVSPEIAKVLVDGGCKLFSLHQEERSLETVFREVSSKPHASSPVSQ